MHLKIHENDISLHDPFLFDDESVGSDFPTYCMAGTLSTTMVRRGEHLACTQGAHSTGTVASTKMAPRLRLIMMRNNRGACATARW